MLDVIVGIESGKPHHTAKAALHSPHPVHGFGIDPAYGGIEHDAPEHLEAGDVLAREPCAIGGGGDMVLEHQRLEAPLLIDASDLFVVQRAAEDVGRRMDVRVHKSSNGNDRRGGGGKTRTCAKASRAFMTVARPAAPTIATPALSNARRLVCWLGSS
jgi:hypothetical protein